MAARSLIPRLTDIIEAIERILSVLGDIPLDVLRPIGNGSVARRAPRRDYFRGEPPPYGGPEGPSSRNSLAESGGHRQRAAPQLRKHRCAHHMEASAGRFAASRKSLSRRTGNGAGPQTARLIVATHARGRGFISSGCGWIALRSGQRDCRNGSDKQMIRQSAICE